ncbi:hypothetical protein C474_01527 [Halogeometricum pallidum JCM 14848]|uniref:DUF2891 domain-containing protein n=1 Tax=Halogeometricum pallidum JCM 14848 TaxID=1227487 RepID=M0DHU0_HALPD|nr:DUF2891 domain-containing protein [Halogeometricum pallidum]ELZ35000.1 hypothetical protein C474_01527 [Halogeometricum pallidum JCM 14848]
MNGDDIDAEAVLSGRSDRFGPEMWERLARYPLESLDAEFPHYVRQVDSPDGAPRPRERHPVFYGCYDWHSAVHSHWALVRQLRLAEEHPNRTEIVESVDARLTPENVRGEVQYLEANPAFEKPYGWAWLLHLDSELSLWGSETAERWRSTLEPLTRTVRSLVESAFLTQERPFRVGTHGNSAFALHCVHDHARTVGAESLADAVAETAEAFFGDDEDSPVEYEPLEWDFLSPSLTEADLMRRIYDRAEFRAWADRFFPDVTTAPYESVLEPARVDSDPEEGVALHLVGLNVSKAWALAGVADALGDHAYADPFAESARRHAERGLKQAFTDDYAGSHWLSSFVCYLLTRNEGGIAPA